MFFTNHQNIIPRSVRRLFMLGIAIPLILSARTQWDIQSSDETQLTITVQCDPVTPDDLKPFAILIGLPSNSLPEIITTGSNPQSLPDYFADEPIQSEGIRWINIQRYHNLWVGTLEISPLRNDDSFYPFQTIIIRFPDPARISGMPRAPKPIDSPLNINIVNWSVARQWAMPRKQSALSRMAEFPVGQWISFTVADDGIKRIPGSAILALDPSFAERDPRSFMLFTGTTLGRKNLYRTNQPITENMVEVAIQIDGESDGELDADDELIFYARGASGFDLSGENVSYNQNVYFTENKYWLLVPDNSTLTGKRIETLNETGSNPLVMDYGITYLHHGEDYTNLLESGLMWVQNAINQGGVMSIPLQLTGLNPTPKVEFTIRILGHKDDNAMTTQSPDNAIQIYFNSLATTPIVKDVFWEGSTLRTISDTVDAAQLDSGYNTLFIKHLNTSVNSKPYFDYGTVAYGRNLIVNDAPVEFFIHHQDDPIRLNFQSTGSGDVSVWDITDPADPEALQINTTSGSDFYVERQLPSTTDSRFIAFPNTGGDVISMLTLHGFTSFSSVRSQSHAAEHIIIGPEDFRSAAQPLVEHRGNSRFIAIEDIYREFTGGNADPMAIRYFIQWTQEQWPDMGDLRPFILLMGDADYDYRNITGDSRSLVPTIEYNARATDDRLATIYGSVPAVPIGRFPAQSVTQVTNFVEKIIVFESDPIYDLWRQRITLVADDAARPEDEPREVGLGKSHTLNSEILADLVAPTVSVQKLYMIEFPEVSDASSYGVVKPDATEALFDIVEEGTALINYIGHGSPHQLAQERLLFQDRGDVSAIKTHMRLPVWIAGTCSWGHYDALNNESFAEDLIRQPMDGASAIITTSRLINVGNNQQMTERIFRAIFPEKNVTGKMIGEVLQSVKSGGLSGELFQLFGDPAMALPLPADTVSVTGIEPDTLRTLETGSFSGNQSITTSGGTGYVVINDAPQSVVREYNFLGETKELAFSLSGKTLFRGQFSFSGADFNGQVRLPKDISYSGNPGNLSVYLLSEDAQPIDALGSLENVMFLGGETLNDATGPLITFETGLGRTLRSGDSFNQDEGLIIRLSDPLGINVAGEIGHEIMLTNRKTGESKDVTHLFVYDVDNINTGTISLLTDDFGTDLDLHVKAWDSANNPAEATILLRQNTSAELRLLNVVNFPNPFKSTTQFTFEITQPADISIDIFTLNGEKIYAIEDQYFTTGYHQIDWNGRDAYGGRLANGVYLYRIKAVGDQRDVSHIGRLAKFE